MINNKHSVVFFGAGSYVVPVIETLNKNFELVLVVTTETSGPVVTFCKSNNIPFVSASSLKDFVTSNERLATCKVAVLASFGLIIPDSVLNMFEYGIINIHPSLLPKYRGPTPVQSAILNGETTTGVSVMKLDSEVDHGEILVQKEEKIVSSDTSESLYKRLFKIGADLLVKSLPEYLSRDLKPLEQDHSKATFTKPLTRESGFVDINKPPEPQVLERMIRAYYPWPGVWIKAKLNGAERLIKLFPEQKIQVEGKNIMSFKDFENGYPEGKEILVKLNLFD